MLDAEAVADAVLFAVTRPERTAIHSISLERA
jgi:NADP-dependent 3-hydroxy acid dehydrogenase YdfG